MKTLTINFDKAYPAFSPEYFTDSCKVEEPENAGKVMRGIAELCNMYTPR